MDGWMDGWIGGVSMSFFLFFLFHSEHIYSRRAGQRVWLGGCGEESGSFFLLQEIS